MAANGDEETREPEIVFYGAKYSKKMLYDEESRSALRECQKQALLDVVAWFSTKETQNHTAVVVMPTGTGKTGVICCLPYVMGGAIKGVIEDAKIPQSVDMSKPILVIAPGLSILYQLEANLKNDPFLKKIGIIDSKRYYTLHTIRKPLEVPKLENFNCYDIILSNSQKWRKDKEKVPNYEDLPNDLFSMVIVDEAHHLPAKQWKEIVDKFRDHAKVVFFTATPIRYDGRPISTDLDKTGYAYELTRDKAIKDKLIRNTTISILTEADSMPPNKKMKIDDDHEDLLADSPPPNRSTIKVLTKIKDLMDEKNKSFPLPGNKKHASIIITKDTEEADKVKKFCKTKFGEEFGKKVVVVHSKEHKNNESRRKKVLEDIQNGKYEMLVVVAMLLEGFDYPPLSIAGIATNIVSSVKFAQFIGRIQRVVRHKKEDGTIEVEENITADVITHVEFKQKDLYDKYIDPRIQDEENTLIDNDCITMADAKQ